MNSAFDVIAIGRVGIDLYPLQDNVTLDHVTSFEKFIGGSATNLAIAAARHGLKSAIITRTGSDPFGRFIMDELSRLGVSNQFVSTVPILHTPIVFAEIFPPDNFPLYYYRDPKAPDLMIESHELDLPAIRRVLGRLAGRVATTIRAAPGVSGGTRPLPPRADRGDGLAADLRASAGLGTCTETKRLPHRLLPHVAAMKRGCSLGNVLLRCGR